MTTHRLPHALVAALFLVTALAPCPLLAGPDASSSSSAETTSELPSVRVYCPCGCGPAPPTLRIAGATLAPPPPTPLLALPPLCHVAHEGTRRLPEPPRPSLDHVPLPV